MKNYILLKFKQRWKVIFWLTVALLLIFSATPRGYAQALPEVGTSSENSGTSSQPVLEQPAGTSTEPAVVPPVVETAGTSTGTSVPVAPEGVVEQNITAPLGTQESESLKQPVSELPLPPSSELPAQYPYKK